MSRLVTGLVFVLSSLLLAGCGGTDGGGGGSTDLPATPSNLVATAAYARVTLQWESDEIEHRVHYGTDSFAADAENYPQNVNYKFIDVPSDNNVDIVDLTNDTAYYFLVTSVKDGVESTASNEVTATPAVTPTGKLNDTGITRGGDALDGNNGDCTGEAIAVQDCSHGRDSKSAAELNKVGSGAAGFDFTKLDANGKVLAASATSWSCVLDNVTGFVWEVKTTDDGLHDKDDTYNWYDTNPAINGGDNGFENDDEDICFDYDANDSTTYCNTQAYVARVNAKGLCGANDWRLPKLAELAGIAHKGTADPAIDTNFFPNTESTSFWSSSPYASYSGNAWVIYFSSGYDDGHNHNMDDRVRLVRSGDSSIVDEWPDSRYTVHDDGTVTDKVTKLMWQQCIEGLSGQNCNVGVVKKYSWAGALGVPATVNAASTSYNDWRLPNIEELRSLAEFNRYDPAINVTVFPNTESDDFWSSSPVANYSYAAWVLYFDSGNDGLNYRSGSRRVRLVRDTE